LLIDFYFRPLKPASVENFINSIDRECLYFFSDRGRELYFPAYYFYAHKRLVNHWVKNLTVNGLDECEYHCYLDANCVSLNIKNKDPDGKHECELNNSTHMEHGSYLDDNQIYYYRGAEVGDYILRQG